jgi:hypothetical protein
VKLKGLLLALVVLVVTLEGCGVRRTPTSPNGSMSGVSSGRRAAPTAAASQTIGNYDVHYDGRTVAGGQTTFAYTVSGAGVGSGINHFVIQLPACAPALASSSPSNGSVVTDPNSGLFGIKWGNLSIGPSESAAFSITFPGNVPEGLVRVSVKAGNDVGIGILPGPCQGWRVTGTVYIDQDSSRSRNGSNEPGILANVTVALVDGSGNVETTLTDAVGNYSFPLHLEGSYTVRVDAATPTSDFNETLAQSFNATGPTSVSVTLGPDATVNFGYKPQTRKLIADFNNGILSSTGLPASFWIKALRSATRGDTYGGYDANSLKALLAQIEGSFLPVPYQFTDGNELQEALAIIAGNPRTSRDALYQTLLVSELNNAAGKGIVGQVDLQKVLLSWAESLIAASSGSAVFATTDGVVMTPAGRWATIEAATSGDEFILSSTLLKKVNNERGGGGGIPQ